MNIKKKADSFDFGVTLIENIFIEEYMPYCEVNQLKVYLMGLKLLQNKDVITVYELEKKLNISTEEVKNAYMYWQGQSIVKVIEHSEYDFDIEYVSMRDKYLNSNYKIKSMKTSYELRHKYKSLYNKINLNLAVPLTEMECQGIAKFLDDKSIEPEIVVRAFTTTKKKKNRLYGAIELITHWTENGITTIDELEVFTEKFNKRQMEYKKILKSLGFPYSHPNSGDKECIDRWLDEYKLDLSDILMKISSVTKTKRNPNMNYLDKVMFSLTEGNKKSVTSSKELTEKELEELLGGKND
ncbi:MAG: hypothetical protein CSB16_01470 [Clostridiales bacterium]|nr:MAG: hypothetical protein CSB16_01470 [Clostridiales bacterium]